MNTTLKPIIVVVDHDVAFLEAVKNFVRLEMLSNAVFTVPDAVESISLMHDLPGPAIFMVGPNLKDMSANILITHIKQTFRFAHFCFLLVKDEDQEVMASALKIGALPFQKTPPNGKGRYNLGTAFKGYMEYAEAKLAELTMDSLTGLYNRTAGLSIWERDYIRGARSRSTTCLIYCDLDSLKYMNDAHGHEKGDIMIKTVADSILQHVRTSYDYAIRIGGDEFIIVMPETKQSAAVGVKKRLQDHIKALSIELDGNSRPISVSMGLSVLRPASRVKDPIEAFNSLVKRAEAKMYIEKKARKAALTLVEKMKNT